MTICRGQAALSNRARKTAFLIGVMPPISAKSGANLQWPVAITSSSEPHLRENRSPVYADSNRSEISR